VDQILDARGNTILAFAQVEWFLAKIIIRSLSRQTFPEYCAVDLSFSQDADKRATVTKKISNVQGPFSPYANDLVKTIDTVVLRHCAITPHAIEHRTAFVRPRREPRQ
jgi:hypothetical protein